MPYIYNSIKQAQALTVQFQGNKDIPQLIMANFFSALTKIIAKIFLAYKDDDKKIRKILGKILRREENEIKQLSDTISSEAISIMKLRQGDIASFKQVIDKEKLSDTEIQKYAELMKDMIFCHIFHLISELNSSILAKTSQMWKKPSENSSSTQITEAFEEEEALSPRP